MEILAVHLFSRYFRPFLAKEKFRVCECALCALCVWGGGCGGGNMCVCVGCLKKVNSNTTE